jgi:outer membrane receptor protein involved in Fe transport
MVHNKLGARLALLLAFTLLPLAASAQLTTASIAGTALDETKGVLPGVTITVTNVETGVARTTVSDDRGYYQVANLPPGNYEVLAELAGFQKFVRSGITLTVGREAVVEMTLRVGDINERVVVTGEAPLVDVSRGSLGEVVESKTITELPINSRDLAALVTLQTGATNYRIGRAEGGAGMRLTVGGMRPTSNVLLMDGVALESYHGFVPTGTSETFLGVEAVREFKVETNAYSAEFGRSTGGVFNVVTKSGTNDFHGSVFEFLRNDALDAKNFFDEEKPPFRRNQFGFSLGGRIIRNRTFFFGNYEGLRERLGLTTISQTFTAAARQGVLGNRTVTIDPRVRPYLVMWPLPNGPILDHGDGTGDYSFTVTQPTNENFYQARVDQQISEKDSIFARYTTLRSDRILTLTFPTDRNVEEVRNDYLTVEHKRIFSPNVLNTFRFGLTITDPTINADQDPWDPSLRFIPPVPLVGDLSVSGVTGVGNGVTGEARKVTSFQFIDDVAWTRGIQSLKFGINWNHLIFDGWNPARDAGNYAFGSIADFFNAVPNRFRGAIAEDFNDPFRLFDQNIVGLYVQDDIRLTPRFTLNAGIRYEFITVPVEEHGRVGNFRGDLDFIQSARISDITLGNPWFDNPSLNNFAPRVGFAWDVAGDGKTAIRGGFGIFHLQFNQSWIRTTAFRMPPFLIEMQASANIPFPNIYQVCGPDNPLNPTSPLCSARAAPDFVPYTFDTPTVQQYNVNIQRQLSERMVLTVGYAGSRGDNLPGVADVNIPRAEIVDGRLFFAATTRPNPNFDDLRYRFPGADSTYNSLQVTLNRRFDAGLQFRGSYAFSKSIDDTSGNQTAGDVSASTNWVPYYYDITWKRGLSSFNTRHNASFNATYELPFGPGRRYGSDMTGFAAGLLSGWQLSGIVALVSGFPGAVEIASPLTAIGIRTSFPDLVEGADNNPIREGNSDQYIDPASFAFPAARTMGNLGRNTIILPGLANVDFSLTKNTYFPGVSDQFNVQFRLEVFNLFNRVNLGVPNMVSFDNRGRPDPTFGRITETATPARQVQLGLKVLF